MRGKEKERELEAAALLSRADFASSPLRASVDLGPDSVTEDALRLAGSPYAQAVLYESLMAILTDAPAQCLGEARERWVLNCPTGTFDSRAAGLVFDVLLDQYRIVCSVLRELHPATYARLRDEAVHTRIACILENMQRREPPLMVESTAEAITKYCDQVKKAHGHLNPPDFERRRYVPIADLYVAPTLTDDSDRDSPISGPLELEIDRTVLLGDPGNGKSTASQVLIHRLARYAKGPVPFLVILRDFALPRPTMSVVEYLERHLKVFYQTTLSGTVIEHLLRSGRALVVFDGLDELIDTSARRDVTDVINNFCNAYPTSKVLVTSRRVGYYQAPMDPRQFRVIQLSEFDDAQVFQYVKE